MRGTFGILPGAGAGLRTSPGAWEKNCLHKLYLEKAFPGKEKVVQQCQIN
jgi:hypothetical protein